MEGSWARAAGEKQWIYDDVGSGEPILFIHGLGCLRSAWAPQYELMNGYRLICPALRGHDESPVIENISLAAFARDIIELMDKLGIENAHICGLSLGGLVAQEMYRMAPERVKSLILVNTFAYIPRPVAEASLWRCYWKLGVMTTKVYIEQVINECLFNLFNPDLRKQLRSAFYIRRETYMPSAKAGAYADFRDLLPEIKVPVLLIGGSHDRVTPPVLQTSMYRKIPCAEIEILPRTGHMSNIENAKDFNRKVRWFLERK